MNLVKTPSNTSSASSPSTNVASGPPSANISRKVSAISLSGPTPEVGYKSFEHHLLKPDDAARRDRSSTSSSTDRHQYREKDKDKEKEKRSRSTTIHLFRSNHHHHSHHIRDRDDDPTTPRSGIHELPPEVIIEAVFNPHPATEEGPFTFVPASKLGLDHEDALLDKVIDSADPSTAEEDKVNGREHKFGWGGRMRARKERKEKERQAKVSV